MQEFLAYIFHHYLWLIPMGFIIGAGGTFIGVGGGFVLVPALLLLYPDEAPETITSISLAVVFFNALSGSLAYAHAKRIDYRSGLIFSAAAVPGAVLGALSTALISRQTFEMMFGILTLGIGSFLVVRPWKRDAAGETRLQSKPNATPADGIPRLSPSKIPAGITVSAALGYFSSVSGVGAGILYVPAFIYLLDFPVYVATATSQFVLAIIGFAGTVTHVAAGMFQHGGSRRTAALALGVILGAQLGAWASKRVKSDWIVRGLAIALCGVGMRLLVSSW